MKNFKHLFFKLYGFLAGYGMLCSYMCSGLNEGHNQVTMLVIIIIMNLFRVQKSRNSSVDFIYCELCVVSLSM